MIDLHTHILPGLDDGAKDLEQAARMAEMAVKDGVKIMVATPHHLNGSYLNPPGVIRQKVEEVNRFFEERGIPLQVLVGMEAHIQFDFVQHLIEGSILPLHTSKYVLLELPYHQSAHHLDHLIYEMQMNGYIPVIPHPERVVYFQENPHLVYDLVKKGAVMQITAGSLMGWFGKKTRDFTKELIRHQLAHLVASDAHDDGRRGPGLSQAYEIIARETDWDTADWMRENAESVINGQPFWLREPIKPHKRRFFGLLR